MKPLYNIFTPWKVELFYRTKALFMRKKHKPLAYPNKILLCNQGALGDVFLTTCMIPSLKKTFPNSKIDILITPQSRAAVEGCPGIEKIHELQPWFDPLDSKWKRVQKRLKYHVPVYDYDCVICTFPFYRGVCSSLCNIPARICFETLGDRLYFNHVIPWEEGYIGRQYENLLKYIGVENPQLQCPWPLEQKTEDYVLFHICSADSSKEFPLSFWQDVCDAYRAEGRKVFFTGSGTRQEKLISQIASPEENGCNRLSFALFLQKIAQSDHILTVDTVTLHIAAILKKRYFAFFQKPSDLSLWFPNTSEGSYIL